MRPSAAMRPASGVLRLLRGPAGLSREVRRALFGELFRNTWLAHVLAIVVALFLGAFAWRHLQLAAAVPWTVLFVALELGIVVITRAGRPVSAEGGPSEARIAGYVALNHLNSLLWAVAATLFIVPAQGTRRRRSGGGGRGPGPLA